MIKNLHRELTVSIIILIFSLSAGASKQHSAHEIMRGRLVFLTEQFAQEVLHAPEDAKKIKELETKNVHDTVVFRTLKHFGREMFERGEQIKAFEYFRQVLDIMDDAEPLDPYAKRFKSTCYLMLGASTDEVGLHQLSVDYYLKGLRICEELNDRRNVGMFYNNLGVSCIRANDRKKAKDYFKKALAVNTKYQNNLDQSINYSNLSEIEAASGNMDAALEYALKAKQCIDEKNYPYDYYSMQSVIGSLYMQRNETHMAKSWLENAYVHQKSKKYDKGLFYTCLELMELCDASGDMAGFEKYNTEAGSIAKKSGNYMLLNEYYRAAGDHYNSHGDYQKAYGIAQKYIAALDSANVVENKSRMEQALNLFNLEKKTQEYENSIENWNPV